MTTSNHDGPGIGSAASTHADVPWTRRWLLAGLAATAMAGCRSTTTIERRQGPEPLQNAPTADPSVSRTEFHREVSADQGFNVHMELGKVHDSQGNHEAAIGEYQKALEFCEKKGSFLGGKLGPPQKLLVERRLAGAYDRLGKFTQAEVHYGKALALAPRDVKVWNDVGYSYYLQNRFEDAERALKTADSIEPGNSRVLTNLGLTQAAMGKSQEALQALSRSGGPAVGHANLGFIMAAMGKNEEAKEHYSAALALQPQLVAARTALEQLDVQARKATEMLASAPAPASSAVPATASAPAPPLSPAEAVVDITPTLVSAKPAGTGDKAVVSTSNPPIVVPPSTSVSPVVVPRPGEGLNVPVPVPLTVVPAGENMTRPAGGEAPARTSVPTNHPEPTSASVKPRAPVDAPVMPASALPAERPVVHGTTPTWSTSPTTPSAATPKAQSTTAPGTKPTTTPSRSATVPTSRGSAPAPSSREREAAARPPIRLPGPDEATQATSAAPTTKAAVAPAKPPASAPVVDSSTRRASASPAERLWPEADPGRPASSASNTSGGTSGSGRPVKKAAPKNPAPPTPW